MINAPNVQEWLSGIGLVYWVVALIAAGFAWKLTVRRSTKIISAMLILGFFLYWPVSDMVRNTMERSAFTKRYEAAAARFAERCKIAGDRIVRTVVDVDGIAILKMRTTKDKGYGIDQFAPSAAFYHESTEEFYLNSFLWFEEDNRKGVERGRLNTSPTAFRGYQYLDYVDPTDGKPYRYRMVARPDGGNSGGREYVTVRSSAADDKSRYGVTFEDIVDPGDREHWIAGSIVKIVDLQTSQEIARHTRFAFDSQLGSRAAHRTPWASPEYCPSFQRSGAIKTRHFVDQVLIPRREG